MLRILSREKDIDFPEYFPKYCEQIKSMVQENLDLVKNKVNLSQLGIFRENQYLGRFTFTGSLQTTNLNELANARGYFHTKNGRLFKKNSKFILRGPRYLAAIDPGLSIPQKLTIYLEDLHEGIEFLKRLGEVPSNDQFKIIAPILDYIKNSIMTCLCNRGHDKFPKQPS